MDKREYQEKLQEINGLIAVEDYEGAARVADTIDWKRVRNVQTLVMISEVYEALERYEDSKVLLLRAYRRSPLGRTVLYRLVECTIKLGQYDQAIEYYSEYVQAAPHDNNKYILKYKIYRARGSSLDEQIDILKEYLDQEYNEKWAYELARLQIQADRVQEGLATCDDLVLWFHSGKYVIKALELKKKYAPLTPKQQEIYDNRFNEEEEEDTEVSPDSYLREATSMAKAERAAAAADEIKSELAADISHTAQMEASKEELSRKAEEVQAEVERKAAESEKALVRSANTLEDAKEQDRALASAGQESAGAVMDQSRSREAFGSSMETATETGSDSESSSKPEKADSKNSSGKSVFKRMGSSVAGFFSRDTAGKRGAETEAVSQRGPADEGEAANTAPSITSEKPVGSAVDAIREIAAEAESVGAAATIGTVGINAMAEAAEAEAKKTSGDAQDDIKKAELAEEVEAAVSELSKKAAEAEEAVSEAPKKAAEAEEAVSEESKKAAEAEEAVSEESKPAAEAKEADSEESKPAAEAKEAVSEEPKKAAEAEEASGAAEAVSEVSTETAEMPEEPEPVDNRTPEERQADMVRSMREIVSGVGPKDQLSEDESVLEETIDQSKEDQENAVAARGADRIFRVPVSEASQKRTAGKLTIDDILLSMSDNGNRIREVTGGSVMSAEEEAQMTAQQQADAKEASYEAVLDSETPEIPKFLREDIREAKNTEEIPAAEIAQADDAMRAAMGAREAGQPEENKGYNDGKMSEEALAAVGMVMGVAATQTSGDGSAYAGVQKTPAGKEASTGDLGEAAEAAALLDASKVSYTKEIAEAKTRRLPVEEIRKLHEAYLADNAGAAEEAAKNASQAAEKAAEMAEAEVAAGNELSDLPADPVLAEGDEDMKIAKAPGTVPLTAEGGEAKNAEEAREGEYIEETAGDMSADSQDSLSNMEGVIKNEAIGEQVTREVPKSAPEPNVLTGTAYLKENQMDLFRGFTSIGSLSEQIAGAIWQAEHRKDDRTSRSGNILILGAHGCGKTTIATGIAKAIAEDKGTHSVKMARIYAADLNRKDIAATIAKIAGGVLIVEEAGDLDDAIVDQLTTAMEFRTDGMIMILEDEQRYIHDLLMRHPRFTMKFTAQIYIPEYSAEELVNFGRIYAESQDYVFSEKAVEACVNRIEAAKKSSEAVSVTNMIELVDRAIKNANKFMRRIGSAKKRYDDQDRVILREKDFR